jgi:hypothetical protein
VRKDLLDHRLFQDRRNDLPLATAVRTVHRRQYFHWFAERSANQTTQKRPLPSAR